jgi:hypothetical protein
MAKAFLRAGFFRELHKEPGLPSIHEAVGSTRHPDESRIVAYLEEGICLAACGGVQRDVLNPASGRMTSPDMMTDYGGPHCLDQKNAFLSYTLDPSFGLFLRHSVSPR